MTLASFVDTPTQVSFPRLELRDAAQTRFSASAMSMQPVAQPERAQQFVSPTRIGADVTSHHPASLWEEMLPGGNDTPYTLHTPPPLPAPAVQSHTAARQPKVAQRSSPSTIFLLFTIIVLILGSGGLLYYAKVVRPAQMKARLLVQARQTALVRASETALMNARATATEQAVVQQTTATAVAVASIGSNLYRNAINGSPLLNSSLGSNDVNSWDEYRTKDGGGCDIHNGTLHVALSTPNTYVPCFEQAMTFGDAVYQVDMTFVQGDEGGLIFRGNDALSQFYLFCIKPDGSYALVLSEDAAHSIALTQGYSSAIHTAAGQTNTLSVIAQGVSFYLYVNRQYVAHVVDASYHTGAMGVFAAELNNKTEVTFGNALVWTL